ncbi:hypothetical protein ACE6H2_013544 [Prunus campanulata]
MKSCQALTLKGKIKVFVKLVFLHYVPTITLVSAWASNQPITIHNQKNTHKITLKINL